MFDVVSAVITADLLTTKFPNDVINIVAFSVGISGNLYGIPEFMQFLVQSYTAAM